MGYTRNTFSWEQGSWLTAGITLLGSSFLALSPMADNLVSIFIGSDYLCCLLVAQTYWYHVKKEIPYMVQNGYL